MIATGRHHWFLLALAAVLAISTWALPETLRFPGRWPQDYEPFTFPPWEWNHQVQQVVPDERPAFRIDTAQPWSIEFGRGSGMYGLETVKIDSTGRVVLHRPGLRRGPSGDCTLVWETATVRLPPEVVAEVLAAVEENHLLNLHRVYSASAADGGVVVVDGNQWVLWIRQGGREKTVYCDNHFPDPIVRFAERLDAILSASTRGKLRWRPVPDRESNDHELDLWDSIKR
jgi:hypothetical protein